MKLVAPCILLAISALLLPATSAFVVVTQSSNQPLVRLEMAESGSGRRQVLQQGAMVSSFLLSTAVPALAERPTYLTEPTEEFKESERQRAEFRKQQLVVKQKFVTVLDRLTNESKTEEQLEADLKELKALVKDTGGLPLGIRKEDLIKQIRTEKAKGFWPTNVEIAYVYETTDSRTTVVFLFNSLLLTFDDIFTLELSHSYQALISEIRFQQSPNTEKDLLSPL